MTVRTMDDRFNGELDYTLVHQYIETKDEKYLEEWLQSEHSLKVVIQVLRGFDRVVPGGKRAITAYLAPTREYIGDVHPELVSLAYLSLGKLIRSYTQGDAKIHTYIFSYLPHHVARLANNEMHQHRKYLAAFKEVKGNDGELQSEEVFLYDKRVDVEKAALLDELLHNLDLYLDSEVDKQVISYTALEYTQRDICKILNLTPIQVHWSIKKTRQILKTHFPEYLQN